MTQWTPGCWWVSNMWQNITSLSLGRLVRRPTEPENLEKYIVQVHRSKGIASKAVHSLLPTIVHFVAFLQVEILYNIV